jgi:uncharacterized protein DUF5994
MASCWLVGSGSGPGPRRRSGGDRDPARQRQYGGHPGGGAAGIRAAIPAGPPSPQVSFDDARDRHGAADGRWWPQSRNALTELPGLIAALDSRPGMRVQRLSIHRDDWDDIPRRLTADGGHVIRVDWFTTIPRHTVGVTKAGSGPGGVFAALQRPPAAPGAQPAAAATRARRIRRSHRPDRAAAGRRRPDQRIPKSRADDAKAPAQQRRRVLARHRCPGRGLPADRVAAGCGHQRAAAAGTAPDAHRAAAHPAEEPGTRHLGPQPGARCPAADMFGIKDRAWLAAQDLPADEQAATAALLRQLDFRAPRAGPDRRQPGRGTPARRCCG